MYNKLFISILVDSCSFILATINIGVSCVIMRVNRINNVKYFSIMLNIFLLSYFYCTNTFILPLCSFTMSFFHSHSLYLSLLNSFIHVTSFSFAWPLFLSRGRIREANKGCKRCATIVTAPSTCHRPWNVSKIWNNHEKPKHNLRAEGERKGKREKWINVI